MICGDKPRGLFNKNGVCGWLVGDSRSDISGLWWPRNGGRTLLKPVGMSSSGRGPGPGRDIGKFGWSNIWGGCNECNTSWTFDLNGFDRFVQSGDPKFGDGPNNPSERDSLFEVNKPSMDLSKMEQFGGNEKKMCQTNMWKRKIYFENLELCQNLRLTSPCRCFRCCRARCGFSMAIDFALLKIIKMQMILFKKTKELFRCNRNEYHAHLHALTVILRGKACAVVNTARYRNEMYLWHFDAVARADFGISQKSEIAITEHSCYLCLTYWYSTIIASRVVMAAAVVLNLSHCSSENCAQFHLNSYSILHMMAWNE